MKYLQSSAGRYLKTRRNDSLIRVNSLLFLLVGLFTCLLFFSANPDLNFSISLSDKHPFLLNVFFVNVTFMGSYSFAVLLILMQAFFYKRTRLAFSLCISVIVSVIFVQVVKNFLNGADWTWFTEKGQYLFFEEEYDLANYYQLPSAYTATGFAIASVIASHRKFRNWKIVVFSGAFILGFSRIYLAQHTITEVMAGAILGVSAALIALKMQHRLSFKLKSSGKIGKPHRSTVFIPGLSWKKAY